MQNDNSTNISTNNQQQRQEETVKIINLVQKPVETHKNVPLSSNGRCGQDGLSRGGSRRECRECGRHANEIVAALTVVATSLSSW